VDVQENQDIHVEELNQVQDQEDTHVKQEDTHVKQEDTPVIQDQEDTHVKQEDTHVKQEDTPVKQDQEDTHVIQVQDTHVMDLEADAEDTEDVEEKTTTKKRRRNRKKKSVDLSSLLPPCSPEYVVVSPQKPK